MLGRSFATTRITTVPDGKGPLGRSMSATMQSPTFVRYNSTASKIFNPSYRSLPNRSILKVKHETNIIRSTNRGNSNKSINYGLFSITQRRCNHQWSQLILSSTRIMVQNRLFSPIKNGVTVTMRPNSNSSNGIVQTTRWTRMWGRFAILLRYVRIPVLVVSVYSLGYQQGVIDCTKEPIALQNHILKGILLSTGCTDIDDVHVINDKDIKYHSFRRPDQVAIVGHKVISAARNIVESKLQHAMTVVKSKLPPDISPENELLAMSTDPDVQFYYNARLRINGEQIDNSMWQYIFIDSPTPNAFVTEVLPRKFFITTAMLQVATTPDELAVVLGHEISHLILGHVSSTNKVETFLRTIEVLLLSMDPTAGLLSVFVIGTLFAARRLLSAAYSRENELQADELGLEIAAAACYDTVAGSKVMYKMHQVATGMFNPGSNNTVLNDSDTMKTSSSSTIVQLMDTHPPSLDRYERMLTSAKNGENYTKYIHCGNISRRFLNALWGSRNHNTKSEDEVDNTPK
jgi:Zn-dependent protease with chaperone function